MGLRLGDELGPNYQKPSEAKEIKEMVLMHRPKPEDFYVLGIMDLNKFKAAFS